MCPRANDKTTLTIFANFCKGTYQSKVSATNKQINKQINTSLVVLGCVKPSTCCVLGVSLPNNLLIGAFANRDIKRLVNACIDKTCDWIVMFMFHFKNAVTVLFS